MNKIAYSSYLQTDFQNSGAAVLAFPAIGINDGPVAPINDGVGVTIYRDGPITIEVCLKADAPVTVDLLKNGEAFRHIANEQSIIREVAVDAAAKKGDYYQVLANGEAVIDHAAVSTSFSIVG